MEATSQRWQEITPSEYPWEREAFAFVRERLPERRYLVYHASFQNFLAEEVGVVAFHEKVG
jgi:hypothetical protein